MARPKFPHIAFLRDRDSDAARERSYHLDNLLRIKLGMEPLPPRSRPAATTVEKRRKDYGARAGRHYWEKKK
jgi:hypothetical protein